MSTVAAIFGTRPEAIKLAPLLRLLQADKRFTLEIVSTGQHGAMLEETLEALEIVPTDNLQILSPGQDLAQLTARALTSVTQWLKVRQVDKVVVHGDTTSAAASALAAFYLGLEVHHVEAGLRTNNLEAPFPEEFNRQLIARVATRNYAPTESARRNLLKEGISPERVQVTGNSIVESLTWILERQASDKLRASEIQRELIGQGLGWALDDEHEFGIVTLHRRENQGRNFETILECLRDSAELHQDFRFVFPVHPNPIISDPVRSKLTSSHNIFLVKPLNYQLFAFLLSKCKFILSDSGGIQEEGVTLGKNVILARVDTERPEGIESGFVFRPEMETRALQSSLTSHIESPKNSETMINIRHNPFGDGKASTRILSSLAGSKGTLEFEFS